MDKKALTDKQGKVLAFVEDYIRDAGYPPSLRDICARFGIKSPKNARKHLDSLEKKGFIRRRPGLSRAIEVLEAGANIVTDAVRETVSVPLVGMVKAGSPHLAVQDISGHVALDKSFFGGNLKEGAFLLQAEGESMIEAGIDDGDCLLIAPTATAESGEIVIAMVGDEATVKRLREVGGRIFLVPENREMESLDVTGRTDFSVIGRVTAIIKKPGIIKKPALKGGP